METATQASPSADILSKMPQREKYWSELTDAERIERLRNIIKNLQYSFDYVQSENIKLKNHFYKHSHVDGKLQAPITEYDNSLSSTRGCGLVGKPTNPNEVYF